MSLREHYVVEADGADSIQSVRTALELMASRAASLECDLPFSRRETWPGEVQEAARKLVHASKRPRDKGEQYGQTGILEPSVEVWNAFVTFAPFAYDASVWDQDAHVIVSLADEGQSCVVLLDQEDIPRFRESGLRVALP